MALTCRVEEPSTASTSDICGAAKLPVTRLLHDSDLPGGRYVPEGDIDQSVNDVGGTRYYRRWNGNPECSSSLKIDNEFEFGGLLNGCAPFAIRALQQTASYSITLSARWRKDSEIVSPIALAVLRFTTSVNWVGCWTARSEGLVPFKIRST